MRDEVMRSRRTGRRPAGRRAWCAALLAGCMAAGSLTPSAAELLDRVLAVVSGTVITLTDARTALAFGAVDAASATDPMAVALRWLIDRQLVLDEVTRYDTTEVDESRVSAGLASVRSRFPSDEAFSEGLARLGIDQAGAWAWVRNTIRMEEYLARRFDTVFPVTDEELKAFLVRHQARFTRGGVVPAFEEVRAAVVAAVQEERRRQAEESWLARLRRRAEISELYAPGR